MVTPGPRRDGGGSYSPSPAGGAGDHAFPLPGRVGLQALTVSQRWLPRVVCNCLYGVAALPPWVSSSSPTTVPGVGTSGLLGAPAGPGPRDPAPPRGAVPAGPEDGSRCSEKDPVSQVVPQRQQRPRAAPKPCKLTNLQLAQGRHASGSGGPRERRAGPRAGLGQRHPNNLHHGRRGHKSSQGHRGEAGGKNRLRALRARPDGRATVKRSGSPHHSPSRATWAAAATARAGPRPRGRGRHAVRGPRQAQRRPRGRPAEPAPQRIAATTSGRALERRASAARTRSTRPASTALPRAASTVAILASAGARGGCMKTGPSGSETTV